MPFVQAVGTYVHSTGTDLTVAWPAGVVTGQLGILFVETGDGTDSIVLGTAAGFTEFSFSPVNEGTSPSTKMAMFYAYAASGSPASPVVTGPGNHVSGYIMLIGDGPTAGDPSNAHGTGVLTPASTTQSIPGATTTVDKCLVIAASTTATDGGSIAWASAQANSDLSDVHEVADFRTDDGGGGGLQAAVGVMAVAGAYGTTSVTNAGNSTSAMASIAIPPYRAPVVGSGLAAGKATVVGHSPNVPTQDFPSITDPDPTPGDFTVDRESARLTVVSFTYTPGNSAASKTVWARLGSDVFMVYGPDVDGGSEGFAPMFKARSTITDNMDGTFTLGLLPNGGWWGDPQISAGDLYLATVA